MLQECSSSLRCGFTQSSVLDSSQDFGHLDSNPSNLSSFQLFKQMFLTFSCSWSSGPTGNGLGWKEPSRSSSSNSLPWAGTPSSIPGCSKLHPTWPGTTPGMGSTASASLHHALRGADGSGPVPSAHQGLGVSAESWCCIPRMTYGITSEVLSSHVRMGWISGELRTAPGLTDQGRSDLHPKFPTLARQTCSPLSLNSVCI